MKHYRDHQIVTHQPIMARVNIDGDRFVWLKWPEGQWLAEFQAMEPDVQLIPSFRGPR